MKKIFLLIMCVLILFACKSKYEYVNMEGNDYMKWKDIYFEQIFSQVFERPGNRITFEEVATVEKITQVYIEEDGIYNVKISVYLSNVLEPKIVKKPKKPMKDLADLIYLKNLNYFEMPNYNIDGVEVLKDMPQLKTIVFLESDISEDLLENVAKYSDIENITIPLMDIDYSCLTQMENLKFIKITCDSLGQTISYEPLFSLPSENCLLDLSCIEHQKLTPTLYTLLSTHSNISKIGELYIDEYQDIGFFENMKNLSALDISGSPDFTVISKMIWLKELTIWGSIEISHLSNLSKLESLGLNLGSPKDGEFPPVLSLNQLGEYKNLQRLELYGYVLESLDGVEAYSKLKTLICRTCMLEDITSLAALSQLEYLNLANNLITDISALAPLKNVKYISFDANEISDISPLKNCDNLEFLCLDGNLVADISPLSNLPKLEEIQIQTDDKEVIKSIDLTSWRNTLLSLPDLQYYAGGLRDDEWLSQYLPNVFHGRSDME